MIRRLYDPFAAFGVGNPPLETNETPGTPALLTPADNATVAHAAFAPTWSAAIKALSYDFQKASDSGFTTAVVTTNVKALTISPGLAAGTYHWRVRGVDRYGQPGAWSAGRTVILS